MEEEEKEEEGSLNMHKYICYLLGLLLTSSAASGVVSVRVVPEYLNEAIVEKRLTTSVRSTCLGVACERHQCRFRITVVTNL